jgi:hypothetical protein
MKCPVHLGKYITLYNLSLIYTKQNLRFLSLGEGIFFDARVDENSGSKFHILSIAMNVSLIVKNYILALGVDAPRCVIT